MVPPNRMVVASALLLSFGAVFAVSWRQDRDRATDDARRMATQMAPLLTAGDDMAVIDAVRDLAESPDLLALRVSASGKVLASVGDIARVDDPIPPEGRYIFPSTWARRVDMGTGATAGVVVLLERLSPGPPVWGFLASLLFLAGTFFSRRGPVPSAGPDRPPASGPAVAADKPVQGPLPDPEPLAAALDHLASRSKGHFICLDGRYRVLWASPSIAGLVRQPEGGLTGLHLLDLSPAPELVAAIEEGRDATVARPFPDRAVEKAEIGKTHYGFLLELFP